MDIRRRYFSNETFEIDIDSINSKRNAKYVPYVPRTRVGFDMWF